jgi:hypothetical protein
MLWCSDCEDDICPQCGACLCAFVDELCEACLAYEAAAFLNLDTHDTETVER